MRWVRAYAKDMETSLATNRSIVVDPEHCEPFYMQEHDNYWQLFEEAADDIALMEWDIALSKEDREIFTRHCLDDKYNVRVAPYKHYAFKDPNKPYSYLHRRYLDTMISENEPDCMLFGFGLIYLPYALMKQFLYDNSQDEQFMSWIPYKLRAFPDKEQQMPLPIPRGIVRDTYFSMWHYTKHQKKVPVDWEVRPVHLHYRADARVFSGRKEEFVPQHASSLIQAVNVPPDTDEHPNWL